MPVKKKLSGSSLLSDILKSETVDFDAIFIISYYLLLYLKIKMITIF